MRSFPAAAILSAALWTSASTPSISAAMRTADQVSDRFNQTGRAMSMSAALTDNGRSLGDIIVRVDPDDTISISKASLLSALERVSKPVDLARLRKLPLDMVSLERLSQIGIDLSFDKQKIELVLGMRNNQRRHGDISLSPELPPTSGVISKPASVSGYLNLFSEADYFWVPQQTALRFDMEAVVRLGPVVLESEFSLQNGVDTQLCPKGALCIFDHNGGFKRRGSRAVYDSSDWQSRFTLGDTHTQASTFQRSPDVIGFNIEHAPEKLDPTRPIRATGAQSFILERPSTVEVLINGAIAQHLHLPPGSYNLRDLPLRAGANAITLLITEDGGTSRTLKFDMFSAQSLLATGKSEWSLAGGAPSYFKDGEIAYVQNQLFGTGFFRYGLNSQVTLEAQAQADNHIAVGGGGVVAATAFGIWSLNLAGSYTDGGVGIGGAARLTWDLIGKDNKDALRLAAETHTSGFRTPGQLQIAPTGVILPVYDFKSSYSASYSRELDADWQLAATARYDVANPNFITTNPLVARGDRYHVDLTLSHQLFPDATLSGTVGYSNEVYNRTFAAQSNLNSTKGELWAGLRLFWRPTSKTSLSASADTLSRRSVASGNYQTSNGIESWGANAAISDDRSGKSVTASGEVSYRGQRAEVSVGQDASALTSDGGYGNSGRDARSRVRVGTALVFADGAAAVSAPIRGDGGFAILSPHSSIAGGTVTAGTSDNLRAKSDMFGPAVVSAIPAYQAHNLPIDVAGLPTGYSLGQSGFDLNSPYKAGYRLEVGSDYSVSALGELFDGNGAPLGLAGGIASNGRKQISIFTNQTGKFAADGLAPGAWELRMNGEAGVLVYRIKVPKGSQGLVRLGKLKPAKE